VRLNANEWAEPNPAGDWLTPEELDAVLLNRYPTSAVDLRGLLAERYHVEPDQLVLGNGSNEGDHGQNIARMSVLAAGWDPSVPGTTWPSAVIIDCLMSGCSISSSVMSRFMR